MLVVIESYFALILDRGITVYLKHVVLGKKMFYAVELCYEKCKNMNNYSNKDGSHFVILGHITSFSCILGKVTTHIIVLYPAAIHHRCTHTEQYFNYRSLNKMESHFFQW